MRFVVWPSPIKNLGYAYGDNGYLPPVTVTSDFIGQFYVKLFFGLELVLIMIRIHRAGQRCFELLALIGSPQPSAIFS